MKASDRQLVPPARRTESEGLVVTELPDDVAPDEVVVYDCERHHAHTLNRVAALVWKACDGERTVADIARVVGDERGSPVDERVVWLAVQNLSEKHLLIGALSRRWAPTLTRRELVQLGGIAALPVIASVVVPPASAQSSNAPPPTNGSPPPTTGGPPTTTGSPPPTTGSPPPTDTTTNTSGAGPNESGGG